MNKIIPYVGMRVQVDEPVGNKELRNQLGTIIHVNEERGRRTDYFISVQFDNNIGGHKGWMDEGKDGHCWNMYFDEKWYIPTTEEELTKMLINKKITIEQYNLIKESVV